MSVVILPSRKARGHRELSRVLASAAQEVLVLSAGTQPGSLAWPREVDRFNLSRGVRYRVVCVGGDEFTGLAAAGALVRTATGVTQDTLVVDRSVAVLPADPAGFAVFELPGVVNTAVELFDRAWLDGVPFGERRPGEEPTGRERDLLLLLSRGSTDESAATRLGISPRTVRRMAADLMLRLGARSRFQAGALAADRGWLPPGPALEVPVRSASACAGGRGR